jgi:uncharacterized GH25 family protein
MKFFLSFFLFFALLQGVKAHEFWLQPSNYYPKLQDIIGFQNWVGHLFLAESLPRDPKHLKQFLLWGSLGPQPILGQWYKEPVGMVQLGTSGTFIAGYYSQRSKAELEGEKFEEYLKEKGLLHILALRTKRNENDKPGVEWFSRCAKTLITVDQDIQGPYNEWMGFPLEIVPLQHPLTYEVGTKYTLQVFYLREPLAGVLVEAFSKKEPKEILTTRTDKEGKAVFKLPRTGLWLFNTVHMLEVENNPEVQWESYWASLNFQLGIQEEPPDSTPDSSEENSAK